MNLNVLDIRQLNDVEEIAQQKCLMHEAICRAQVPPVRAGHWARLTLGSSRHKQQQHEQQEAPLQAICRIYARQFAESSVCYLDKSVMVGGDQAASDDDLLLLKVDILQEPVQQQALAIKLHFLLLERFLSQEITLQKFHDLARTYLKGFTLPMGHCTVRTEFLRSLGIAALHVHCSGDDGLDEALSQYYTLDDDFVIEDLQVSLVSPLSQLSGKFHLCPSYHQNALDALDELLALALQQRQRQNHEQNQCYLNCKTLLYGPPGTGKHTLLSHCLSKNKCNVFYIRPEDLTNEYPGELEAHLSRIFATALKFERKITTQAPTVIVLRNIHLICPSEKTTRSSSDANAQQLQRGCSHLLSLIDELYALRSNVVCIATSSEPETLHAALRRPGRFERSVELALPTAKDREQLLSMIVTDFDAPSFRELQPSLWHSLARETQGFVYADLLLLIDKAQQQLAGTEKPGNLEQIMMDILRTSTPISRGRIEVTISRPSQGFETIGGNDALKDKLRSSILAGLHHHEAFQRFGLHLPKGVLLYGPPGCAKTSIAKCLAYEAKMTFISASAAEVYSPYVGHAERFITKIFDAARRNAPCLLFLDEIDTLVGRRCNTSDSNSSSTDVQTRILSTLLMEMDGVTAASQSAANSSCYILVVAATNRPTMVDDALLRPGRFDKLIHVPAPDEASRLQILKLCYKRMSFSSAVNLEAIAKRTSNFSGADIENLCNEAALQALNRDIQAEEVQQEDFDQVLRTAKPSLNHEIIQYHEHFALCEGTPRA